MDYFDFFDRAYGNMGLNGYDSLELYWIGWNTDVISPYNFLVPLFSNHSAYNSVLYYNHNVEVWLKESLTEVNASRRAEKYSKVLHQIVEIDMPHAFGYHTYRQFYHLKNIKGFQYNAINRFYFYPMYRT
jgi:ABC-type transport system substrate-binding protein